MGRYSKAFSIKKQFQSPNCQTCQGQSRTLKKIVFLELFLRIIEEEKWNLFEKIGQLRTPNNQMCKNSLVARDRDVNTGEEREDRGEGEGGLVQSPALKSPVSTLSSQFPAHHPHTNTGHPAAPWSPCPKPEPGSRPPPGSEAASPSPTSPASTPRPGATSAPAQTVTSATTWCPGKP